MDPYLYLFGVALVVFGALTYRAGVRQGMELARMAWRLQENESPLPERKSPNTDIGPVSGECD